MKANIILKTCQLLGHKGPNKIIKYLQLCYYWDGLIEDVHEVHQNCQICQQESGPPCKFEYKQILPSHAFHSISLDAVGPFPTTFGKKKMLLVAIDNLTKWVEALPVARIDAPTTAQFLVKLVIHHHGCPVNIVTNIRSNFTSDIVRGTMELLKVNMKFVAPYRPQENGICKCVNGTLVQIIRKLAAHYNFDWDLVVPNAIFAYNISYRSVTSYSPFRLLYGCEPSIPSTLYLLLVKEEVEETRRYL